MKKAFYIFFFCLTTLMQAQSITEKTFSANNIAAIYINGNSVFKITIETVKTRTISIQSKVEGENKEHIVLVSQIKNDSLFIASKYQPLFKRTDDKLSAHKLIAIELILKIPEDKLLYVSSNISNVIVKGQYKNVTIELINGHCKLINFVGATTVHTIQGHIDIQTNRSQIDASTKNGFLKMEKLDYGTNPVSLYSIYGNITVTKSK